MRNLRIGIIGTGTMGEIYADLCRINARCELVAVCGNTEEKTKKIAEINNSAVYINGDYEGFFSNEALDAVIICTPESIRLEPVELSVKNGVAILLEKPLADSFETGMEILSLLASTKRHLDLCYPLRFSSRFKPLFSNEWITKIGEPKHAYARRDSNQNRAKRVLGKTDLAFWLTPHDIDIFLHYQESPVRAVRAYSSGPELEASDYIVANLICENGFLLSLQISWASPPLSGALASASHSIWGDRGAIHIDDSEMNASLFLEGGIVDTTDTYEDFVIGSDRYGYFRAMLDDFILKASSDADGCNLSAINYAKQNLKICQAISMSLAQQREIKMKEVVN